MNNTNKRLLQNLKSGNRECYEELYRENFTSVERFIVNNSGTSDGAKDIFQDAMLVLIQKLRADNFELTASIKTYITAISKNLWFKKLRNVSYYREIELTEKQSDEFYCEISSSIYNEKTYWDKLQTYLGKITAHCNYLIQSMFFKNKNIEDIQKEFGYSSIHNAQNQKHKCITQLRKIKEAHELTEA